MSNLSELLKKEFTDTGPGFTLVNRFLSHTLVRNQTQNNRRRDPLTLYVGPNS